MKMVLVNGPIQIKRPMKGIGLEHKNMDKELKLGPTGTSTKENLKIVSGAVKGF